MSRTILLSLCFVLSAAPAMAQTAEAAPPAGEELSLDIGLAVSWDEFVSTKEDIRFLYAGANFDVVAALSMSNDKKYGADIANLPDGTFLGNYFLMEEGGLRYRGGGLTLEAGRFFHEDPVPGPYALFLNPRGPSAPSARIRFENDFFLYESVWIELNNGSECFTDEWPAGFPDRGANVKTYALKLGDGMRLGFQDSAVYTGRSFDYEYFLSPVPQYFIQYVKGTDGRPWTSGANENNIIGLFWDWERERARFRVQTLMDDFNLHFILPDTPNNPWKAAWSLNAEFDTALGTFGVRHAGATKHTFQPSVQDRSRPDLMAYGYTYYPDVRFKIDGKDQTIQMADNMVGYVHGENNLAFMADWRGALGAYAAAAALEYVISGPKSPANPWHELYGAVDYSGTKVIAEGRLEHKILASFEAQRRVGAFELFARASVGFVFNELKLEAPGGVNPTPGFNLDDIWIFKPSDTSRALFALTAGGRIRLDLIGAFGLGR